MEYIYIYIYIYTHTHIYIYTHTYIHKYVQKARLSSYMRDPWNVLDGVLICLSLAAAATDNSNLAGFKGLRAVRCLKPLRMLSESNPFACSVCVGVCVCIHIWFACCAMLEAAQDAQ